MCLQGIRIPGPKDLLLGGIRRFGPAAKALPHIFHIADASSERGYTPTHVGVHYGTYATGTQSMRSTFYRVFEGAGTSGFDATGLD